MKTMTITITKKRVYDDIDTLTYKYAEVSTTPTPETKAQATSDCENGLDGHFLARSVEFRDAKLRRLMRFAMADDSTTSATDALQSSTTFTYSLSLHDNFKGSLLQSVATFIHRYLVWGALYDWYAAGMDDRHAGVFAAELEELEAEIRNMLMAQNTAKRPMQPFGPAKPIPF